MNGSKGINLKIDRSKNLLTRRKSRGRGESCDGVFEGFNVEVVVHENVEHGSDRFVSIVEQLL